MAAETHPDSGYWYEGAGSARGARDVLGALRDYRASEAAMRRRTRASMGMGETDLLALRYLLQAERNAISLGPKDLAARLGISSAATTSMIDRLVRSGHVTRSPHPTDRRALVITATAGADQEVRATLGGMHERMIEAADRLDEREAAVVIRFLTSLRDAVDGIAEPPVAG